MVGVLSVTLVKIALSKAPEYPSLNPSTRFLSNANELLSVLAWTVNILQGVNSILFSVHIEKSSFHCNAVPPLKVEQRLILLAVLKSF